MKNNQFTTGYVRARLESAGRTLALLAASGMKPRGFVSNWPEFRREWLDLLDYDAAQNTLRIIAKDEKPVYDLPTSRQISEMDEVLAWCAGLAVYCRVRQIPHIAKTVNLAMQHYPSGKKKYSQRKIAKEFNPHPSHNTIKIWYAEGIRIITDAQNLALCAKDIGWIHSGGSGQSVEVKTNLTHPKNFYGENSH